MTGLVDIAVENDAAANRFVARVDGQTAELDYERFPDRIVLVHTEVPAALRGRGIADKLAHTALEYARASRFAAALPGVSPGPDVPWRLRDERDVSRLRAPL